MTAAAGNVYTSAQFNTSTRDNLNQTAPALVSAAGQILVSTAANALAARTPAAALVSTSENTASTTYAALTTPGPSVTVVTGSQALVALYCLSNNAGTSAALMSFAVSGATTIAAADNFSIGGSAASGTPAMRYGNFLLLTGLTPGSNTFTALYRVGASTGTYQDRRIVVIPL